MAPGLVSEETLYILPLRIDYYLTCFNRLLFRGDEKAGHAGKALAVGRGLMDRGSALVCMGPGKRKSQSCRKGVSLIRHPGNSKRL
jgi:hypothetical protein